MTRLGQPIEFAPSRNASGNVPSARHRHSVRRLTPTRCSTSRTRNIASPETPADISTPPTTDTDQAPTPNSRRRRLTKLTQHTQGSSAEAGHHATGSGARAGQHAAGTGSGVEAGQHAAAADAARPGQISQQRRGDLVAPEPAQVQRTTAAGTGQLDPVNMAPKLRNRHERPRTPANAPLLTCTNAAELWSRRRGRERSGAHP